MSNDVIQKILDKREITINDRIKFRTILDVLNIIFTDENHVSTLKVGYKINEYQRAWFLIITPNSKKEESIKSGYANFLSEDWNTIYQFNDGKNIEKQKQLGDSYIKNKIEFVTFAKITEKSKGIGYHFVGIFIFDSYTDEYCKTMIFKKSSDSFKLSTKNN